VPAYHGGGWFDIFLGGTLRNYAGIKSHGGSEAARSGQRLFIGPRQHQSPPFPSKTGDVDFGPDAALDLHSLALRWFDHVLKGVSNGVEREKPVRIFRDGRKRMARRR
jgi:putative CocE/NonD family hydrolase